MNSRGAQSNHMHPCINTLGISFLLRIPTKGINSSVTFFTDLLIGDALALISGIFLFSPGYIFVQNRLGEVVWQNKISTSWLNVSHQQI